MNVKNSAKSAWPRKLKTFRTKHDLTQKQLAAKLPAGLRTVEDWERGKRKPPDMLKRALRDLARELQKR
jgi:DNA-binding transcriptional regulator YiaG